jgi:hypothetical protein
MGVGGGLGWLEIITRLGLNQWRMLGGPALALLGWAVWRYGRGQAALWAVLVGPWLLWHLLLPQHVAIHETQTILAVPAVAVAAGLWVAEQGSWRRWVVAGWRIEQREHYARLGLEIAAHTVEGSIVVMPEFESRVVYYSWRRTFGRSWWTPDEIHRAYPGRRLYLAAAPEQGEWLARQAGRRVAVWSSPALVLEEAGY